MSKLIRAGVRRYVRNIVFWLAIVATAVAGVIGARGARDFWFDDFYCVIVLFALAVMISWLVGRENDEGIFRNKVVSGHTKGQIYLSELILGVGACVLMFLIFAGIFTAFNSYVFTKASISVCIRIFLDSLLVTMCFGAILVTASCLIPKRAIGVIVNIVVVFAIVFMAYGVQDIVQQEEYYTECDFEYVTEVDENGNSCVVGYEIEGTERLVKNPQYVGGVMRIVYQTVYDILPYGHISEYVYLTNDWFGYDYYNTHFPDEGFEWNKDCTLTDEQSTNINVNLIYSVVINSVVIAIGYVCFRKKELK